jgi:glyoxylase-like metal-dependent hydrolase (beta-lactamase superfamily II)
MRGLTRSFRSAIRALVLVAAIQLTAAAVEIDPLLPQETPAYPADLLGSLRTAAAAVPGALPIELRYITIAESHRPRRAVLENGTDEVYVQARAAFQIVYAGATLMVDAGMDEEVHRGFSMGTPEPYFSERNAALQAALKAASFVVITHEHGDHVAGVVRSNDREAIAAHTLLTKAQVETLTLAPQSPEIRLTPEEAADYLVIDYALYYPVAPGVVLLKSPGHTPGHQMVYLRLANGREYLLSGDVTWAIDGIMSQTQRPSGTSERIREDRAALAQQIDWLASIAAGGEVIVVPSHDTEHFAALERRGLIIQGLRSE